MYKINYYEINCNAFHWIKDFLTDRTQTVILEGETSYKIPVTSGVPQGTELGPIFSFNESEGLISFSCHGVDLFVPL
jgi:hypothetical protein